MAKDLRTVNMVDGQLIEAKKVLKRIGDVGYRDLGVLSKIGLFDTGKVLITSGLRVVASSGMTISVGLGKGMQRLSDSADILPFIQLTDQTVTVSASDGTARTDIIEAQVIATEDKNDYSDVVLDSDTGTITTAAVKRDIKYSLSVRAQKGTITPTAGTAGVLTGTISIPSSINLSLLYLLNIADGEDGSFQEIDLRGADPSATTKAEIISKINTAIGRTIASISGNYIVLTGYLTGVSSKFEIKPPVSDSSLDAFETVFGVVGSGEYDYTYAGTNEWFKLSEIDVGASSSSITTGMIRNVDQKDTWGSEAANILLASALFDSGGSHVALADVATNALACSGNSATATTATDALALGGVLASSIISQTFHYNLTRNLNITYTNSRSYPIFACVTVSLLSGSATRETVNTKINGNFNLSYACIRSTTENLQTSFSFIVPAGATYSVESSNWVIDFWNEIY